MVTTILTHVCNDMLMLNLVFAYVYFPPLLFPIIAITYANVLLILHVVPTHRIWSSYPNQ